MSDGACDAMRILASVGGLAFAGACSASDAGALLARLRGALRRLSAGDALAARHEFGALADEVNALVVAGAIPVERARDLVAAAQSVLDALRRRSSHVGVLGDGGRQVL